MKITVVLTKEEVMEAVQGFLMDKVIDEGCSVISMLTVCKTESPQEYEYKFEVSNETDART